VRVGLLDIGAAGALIAALLLPAPSRPVKPLYAAEKAPLVEPIAAAQADLARNPADATSGAQLAELLIRARQTDWALRIASHAADAKSPSQWRALVAVSAAHADRFELGAAAEVAERALASCTSPGADCADFERDRLKMYAAAMRAGHESGIDPRRNPAGFAAAVQRANPLIRIER
jgi:hypothetical protein